MENTPDILFQYRLSIRFNSDGFSLYIYDTSNLLLTTKEIPCSLFSLTEQEIIKLLSNETESLQKFETTNLICESPVYTTVPDTFFRTENARDFLQFQMDKDKIESIIYNPIPGWGNVVIFSIPKALHKALETHFENIRIIHHITHFLSEEITRNKENIIYIRTRSRAFDAIVQLNGVTHLINSFSYNSDEDICFYILKIFENLSLDAENCQLQLFNAKNKQNLISLLQKYIKHCIIAN